MSSSADGYRRRKEMPIAVVCTGKVAFESYARAQVVINRNQTKERPGRTSYRCIYCGMWHIGTDKGRTSKHRANDFKLRRSYE